MTAFRLLREDEGRPVPATAADLADAAELGPARGAERLARRRLLRGFAAEVAGVHPDAVAVERLGTGQVRITAPEPRYASLAQRGPWVALAISEVPVGVDVETCPAENPLPLHLLHPDERREIEAATDPGALFLRFWTAREAWLKAQGRGLDVELGALRARASGKVVLVGEPGGPAALARIIERDNAIAAIVELRPDP